MKKFKIKVRKSFGNWIIIINKDKTLFSFKAENENEAYDIVRSSTKCHTIGLCQSSPA